MKKINLVLLSTAILAGVVLQTPAVIEAKSTSGDANIITTQEGQASATTTAELTVELGQLSLDSAPDFNFDSYEHIDHKTMKIQQEGNFIEEDHDDSHTKGDGSGHKLNPSTNLLQISDYRGAGHSWKLSASMSNFKNVTVKKGDYEFQGIIFLPGLIDKANISNTESVVWDSKTALSSGFGVSKADLSEGSVLQIIGKTERLQPGEYNAKITWTLQDTSTDPTKG